MPIRDLKARIARLPEQPGVYVFANDAGDTLYVGKARVLRDRVRSYLAAEGTSPRHDALLREADQLDVIVTDSVVEALALENHLIKQKAPRYNILLRDDKNYPYLQVTNSERFPRVLVARRVDPRDGNVYAGPFLPASFARRTMSLTHRLFGIRSCNEAIDGERGRPCLEYDIKRCIAPCVREICSEEEYAAAVADTKLFLEGRTDELQVDLRRRMNEAAADEQFERAAQLRDALRTIQALGSREQKMSTTALGDRDAFGVKLGPAGAVVQVFQMRGGRVIERIELVSENAGSEVEVLEAAVQQFYESREPPPEIHVPAPLPESEAMETWLADRSNRRVRIVVPKRGEKRGLLELASRNAAVAYDARFNDTVAANYDALETLRAVLALPALPRRIECFDISTIQGSETVASMVVCEDGRMRRGEYRKYRIKGERLDDFAAMSEVVLRRYRKLLEQGGPFPDLILIDGGKGQLTAAYEALRQLGLENLVAVGIAKKEELLFTRDRVDPIALRTDSPALHLIQRIRDEAHRFALTFHRAARRMRDLRSELDDVPGIGPRRRRALLRRFGSLAGVRRATHDELIGVVGPKGADAILAHFMNQPHH
ncbi:MAG TPA: excinuclease ABC subunit UvrC [Vicinamibacterales bacterium]|jgi:excinuclease ABC subunit C|nr:excinuclease ABC subunit UvrC [Vicinamibacterales bacterium]